MREQFRKEKVEAIREALINADDYTVQQVYEFLMLSEI